MPVAFPWIMFVFEIKDGYFSIKVSFGYMIEMSVFNSSICIQC